MNHSTKQARFGNPPQFSRKRKLLSPTLRTQEWEADQPTALGLAALTRHAEAHARAVAEGRPVADVLPFVARKTPVATYRKGGRAA